MDAVNKWDDGKLIIGPPFRPGRHQLQASRAMRGSLAVTGIVPLLRKRCPTCLDAGGGHRTVESRLYTLVVQHGIMWFATLGVLHKQSHDCD
jgi:hypothetical protein